jgi:hypothetical protein
MSDAARLRARALSHGFLNWAAKVLACRNTMDNHTAECDRLTDTLAPYLSALEVAREAIVFAPTCTDKMATALARIAALTPLETHDKVLCGCDE